MVDNGCFPILFFPRSDFIPGNNVAVSRIEIVVCELSIDRKFVQTMYN